MAARTAKAAEKAKETAEEKLPGIVIKLEVPIEVEGETIDKVELDGLYDMTLMDMSEVDREYTRLRGERVTATTGIDRLYAALVAAKANHKPYEWLMGLKARDSIRLMNAVFTFFYVRV